MGMRTPKDIGSAINNGGCTVITLASPGIGFSGATKTGGLAAIAPQAAGAGAVNGGGIDRLVAAGEFASCSVAALAGATSGSPTHWTATFKVQHSVAQGSGFADYLPPGFSAVPTLVIQDTDTNPTADAGALDLDLSGANQYVRVVCTVAFTGGSSPTVLVAAALILGGAQQEPSGLG